MPRKTGVAFGRSLQEQFSGPTALPSIFQRTLVLLSQQACGDSGLFVRDADVRKVSLLRQAWDRGQDPLRMVAVSDCCAAAKVLLQWLESLPLPLIPPHMYTPLIRISCLESLEQQLIALQRLLNQVDSCTMQVLNALLAFLHRHTLESSMTPQQLSPVFAPAFLRNSQWQAAYELQQPATKAAQSSSDAAHKLVTILIANEPEVTRRVGSLNRLSPPTSPHAHNKEDLSPNVSSSSEQRSKAQSTALSMLQRKSPTGLISSSQSAHAESSSASGGAMPVSSSSSSAAGSRETFVNPFVSGNTYDSPEGTPGSTPANSPRAHMASATFSACIDNLPRGCLTALRGSTLPHSLPEIRTHPQHASPPVSPRPLSRASSMSSASSDGVEDPALEALVHQLSACSVESLLFGSDEQFEAQSVLLSGVDAAAAEQHAGLEIPLSPDTGKDRDTVMRVSGNQGNVYACGSPPQLERGEFQGVARGSPSAFDSTFEDVSLGPAAPFRLPEPWHPHPAPHQQSSIAA